MKSKFINLKNSHDLLNYYTSEITTPNAAGLVKLGDYGLVAFSLPPRDKQKPHFHTYGDIDMFMVLEGSGYLNLAQIKSDKIVSGTEERVKLKKGDAYNVPPYTLHSIETEDEPIMLINFAPEAHSEPPDGLTHQRSLDLFYPKGKC